MAGWQELNFYNALTDTTSKRVSLFDNGGLEYFCVVNNPGIGRTWRERRAELLERLADAIERGDPPGEVKT